MTPPLSNSCQTSEPEPSVHPAPTNTLPITRITARYPSLTLSVSTGLVTPIAGRAIYAVGSKGTPSGGMKRCAGSDPDCKLTLARISSPALIEPLLSAYSSNTPEITTWTLLVTLRRLVIETTIVRPALNV